MRDILVITIIVIAALVALRRPWIGALSWAWISIMNPHRFAWGFAYSAPVAAITAGCTLIGLLLTDQRRSPFISSPVWWFFAFTLWMTLSWLMGFNPEEDYSLWNRVIKINLMAFVALSLLMTKQHILMFCLVNVASIGILAAKGGLFTILTGGSYLVWGPPESFIADNNHFALAVIMTLPMLHFLQLQLKLPWQKHLMSLAIILCAASALGSHSRGGLIALLAMLLVILLRSRSKMLIILLVLIGILVYLPMMPEAWFERMASIADYEEDASAMGRINAWFVAWRVAADNFFGSGMSYQHDFLFKAYAPFDDYVRAAHSIYFQILGNHGFIGLFLYLMIWISTVRMAGNLRRHVDESGETKWLSDLGSMIQVSLVGYAVGGAFLSMPYFDLPYNLMVIVVLSNKWLQDYEPAGVEVVTDANQPQVRRPNILGQM